MKIRSMRVNGYERPLGHKLDTLVFSWVTDAEKGSRAAAFQVQISRAEDFAELVFDSGKSAEITQHAFKADFTPEGKSRYFWRVLAWSDAGESVVGQADWFETGLMDEAWAGAWVTSPLGEDVHPYFHKNFVVDGDVASARVYMTGVGLYELEMNGKKVGEEYLAPFYNDYRFWLQYQTYDVTDLLVSGGNAVGVLLGNGWYKGRFGFNEEMSKLFGDDFSLLGQIEIIYKDGRREVVVTDESWQALPSPVQSGSIYDGEVYDGRAEIKNRALVSCDLSAGVPVKRMEKLDCKVEERLSPPLNIIEERKPVTLLRTPAGEDVLDFGQVMTGWVSLHCDIPAGEKIFLQYGELLQHDNFYNENLRSAKAEYTYISDGMPRQIRPYFTFYGFRFVKVTSPRPVKAEDFTACVIHSNLERTGFIETSHAKVNQLVSNAVWGQKGNFLDVPTDCPQRDERMGWTGDAQAFASTASFNMYTKGFFGKYMYDMVNEQRLLGGSVPYVVPDVLEIINKRDPSSMSIPHGSCGWGDAATVIPWTLYVQYGDMDALAEQYENMKLWVDFIRGKDAEAGDKRLWTLGFHFADWLALDNPDGNTYLGGTDQYYIASAYYYYSSLLLVKAAQVLGKSDDAAFYTKLAEEVRQAMQAEYFEADGHLKIRTQTAHVLALYFDIARESDRAVLTQDFKALLDENNGKLTTGFLGTAYLCLSLSKIGLSDYAYSLLLNEEYPGWLYEVNMGATTVWERWNSVLPNGLVGDTGMNSMNHYAYGAILDWMYRVMCGLSPREDAPAFRKVRIAPIVDSRLTYAKASYDSAYGLYESGWRVDGGKVTYTVGIPFGGEAFFTVPADGEFVCNGEKKSCADGKVEMDLLPGKYTIVVG